MRVIPLYSWPADPLASHRVTAPGGFEVWEFEAQDSARSLHLRVEFALGRRSDPNYQRAYRRFLRNPTRVIPPLPQRFPFFSFVVKKNDRFVARVESRMPPEELDVSDTGLRFGKARFFRNVDRSIQLIIDLPTLPKIDLCFFQDGNEDWSVKGTVQLDGIDAFEGAGSMQHTFGTDIFN